MNFKGKIKEKIQNLKKGMAFLGWGLMLVLCGYLICSENLGTVAVEGFFELKEDLWDSSRSKKIMNIEEVDPIAEKNRERFNSFLEETKDLKAQSDCLAKGAKAFISYAWKDNHFKAGREENEKLRRRLRVLQQDLKVLGIKAFFDGTGDMHGHVRYKIKKYLEEADFIFLIGTPLFKEKVMGHRLFLMDYFELKAIPKTGNIVVLIKNPDSVVAYYVEKGQQQGEAMRLPSLNLESISWMPKMHLMQEARPSEKTNEVLEEILPQFKIFRNRKKEPSISNAQFEYGIIMDKAMLRREILFPLLFKGEREDAFPSDVLYNFIRDLRNEEEYSSQMSRLSDPVGIIPTICPALSSDPAYIDAARGLKVDLQKVPSK